MPIKKINRSLYRISHHPILAPENRNWKWLWIPAAFVALVIICAAVVASNNHKNETNQTASQDANNSVIQNVANPEPQETAPQKSTNEPSQIYNNAGPTYYVSRVVDGDTIDIVDNGATLRIRLIGVDTPETKDPRKGVQCFGPEASAFTTNQLSGKNVGLETDPSQGDTDKYGRLLRYVYLDGANFNFTLLKEGYGREYTYNTPYKYHKNFTAAQADAQARKAGLWSPSTCNGGL